jgi:hypothetical protein
MYEVNFQGKQGVQAACMGAVRKTVVKVKTEQKQNNGLSRFSKMGWVWAKEPDRLDPWVMG